jgi:hypothetical protein
MKNDEDRLGWFLLACVVAACVFTCFVFFFADNPKQKKISEKWQRWNESYSPEADEPEPPKYEDIP